MSAEAVRAAMAAQARACARLGSPFMARLMGLLSERLAPGGAVADRVLGWPGDPGIAADNPGLRLAGGLHALVLSGRDPALAAAYPPHESPDAALWRAVADALEAHADHLTDWLSRPPQTNEVRRAACVIPALALLARAWDRPVDLWEVGCAAGLNLRADRFTLVAGDTIFRPDDGWPRLSPAWAGPVPEPVVPRIATRRGVDLSPVDPVADPVRVLAYLWPDQPERRALTERAIARAAEVPADIAAADAVDWLTRHLPARRAGVGTVVFHTVAWQYLPPEARAAGDAALARAGRAATADAPLARIAMEVDGRRDAALTLTRWPGGTPVELARVDFHGRSVRWTGPTRLPSLDTRGGAPMLD